MVTLLQPAGIAAATAATTYVLLFVQNIQPSLMPIVYCCTAAAAAAAAAG
jgi:hypothetical protein